MHLYCHNQIHAELYFFFNDTATTEIYTLSLHDALPISARPAAGGARRLPPRLLGSAAALPRHPEEGPRDRKSTRLNSSHLVISYAVFCLKKKIAHYSSVIDTTTILLLAA